MIENKLPKSWVWNQIVDLLAENPNGKLFQQGWSPQCHNHPAPNDHWGVLKTTAIQDGEFWEHENKELPESLEPRPHIEVCEGDILMTCAGPRNRCGVVCFVKKTRQKLLMSGKMYRFRTNSQLLDSKYLEGFIRSHHAQHAIDTMKTGISDSGLNLTHGRFAELMIPLAPLNEQKRIVAKIEELFFELDSGIAALKTAREQLKVYRQAVLKHAFEGKLTAKWREKNADKLESPEQLLARIQQEREDRYQQQLEDWKAAVNEWEANGKEGKKPGKPKKTKVLSGKLVDEIIIPNEWSFSIIGELNAEVFDGPFGSNLKSSDYVDRGVRVIRLENIGEMRFIEDKYSFITEEKYQTILKHTVSGGDIIFSSFMTEGIRVIILPESVDKAVNKADCFCVRMFGESYNPRFLVLYLSSRAAYKQIESEIHGIGRPRINTTQLKSFVVPICSIDEQIQILSEIEQQISEIDATESNIDAQIERAKTLRQSILKKAFSGQLVPQDPSDEPASKLLARIQAEKEFVNTQKTSESNKRHSVSSH